MDIFLILGTFFLLLSLSAAYITAKKKNPEDVVRHNYISHIIYTFVNAYNCIYFFYTMSNLQSQVVYAVRNLIFLFIAILGVRNFGKQLKQNEENRNYGK